MNILCYYLLYDTIIEYRYLYDDISKIAGFRESKLTAKMLCNVSISDYGITDICKGRYRL